MGYLNGIRKECEGLTSVSDTLAETGQGNKTPPEIDMDIKPPQL